MRRDCDTGDGRYGAADLVGIGFDTERIDVGDAVVETALVPEAVLGTADAAVAGLDREGHAAVPAHGGAGVVSGRALAAHLVQAVPLARGFVVPVLDELARIEMRTAVALVVD